MPPLHCSTSTLIHNQGASQWGRVSSAMRRALSGSGFRGFYRNKPAKDTSGSAPTIDPMERQRVMLLCEREILIAEIRHRQNQHSEVCSIRAKLRRLTAELTHAPR